MQDDPTKSPLERIAALLERFQSGQITVTDHARQMMAERQIELTWVFDALTKPEFTSVDPRNPSRIRAFRRIPEAGDHWLRVVYERIDGRKHVITTFLDRKAEQSR